MTHRMGQAESRTELWLLLVIVVWAANYPVSKYGISGLNIFVFNSLRYILAAALLVILFRIRFTWRLVEAADWPRLIKAGFIANVLYQITFIVGLNMTTAGNAAVLLATAPLWTIFINAKINHEAILPRHSGDSIRVFRSPFLSAIRRCNSPSL